jgi:hypothetical protein
MLTQNAESVQPEVGKVTLKSDGDEAFNDDSLQQ